MSKTMHKDITKMDWKDIPEVKFSKEAKGGITNKWTFVTKFICDNCKEMKFSTPEIVTETGLQICQRCVDEAKV